MKKKLDMTRSMNRILQLTGYKIYAEVIQSYNKKEGGFCSFFKMWITCAKVFFTFIDKCGKNKSLTYTIVTLRRNCKFL